MTLTNNSWLQKTAVIAVAGTFGLSHLWMISLIANKESGIPKFDLPVGQYSQYTIDASKDGYSITHRMNDPKVMEMREDVIVPGKTGLFGGISKDKKIYKFEQYTMEGHQHMMGPGIFQTKGAGDGKLTAEQIACIKKSGAGQGTGAAIGAAATTQYISPAVSSIPIIGWVASGFATSFGAKKGGEVGENLAEWYHDC